MMWKSGGRIGSGGRCLRVWWWPNCISVCGIVANPVFPLCCPSRILPSMSLFSLYQVSSNKRHTMHQNLLVISKWAIIGGNHTSNCLSVAAAVLISKQFSTSHRVNSPTEFSHMVVEFWFKVQTAPSGILYQMHTKRACRVTFLAYLSNYTSKCCPREKFNFPILLEFSIEIFSDLSRKTLF